MNYSLSTAACRLEARALANAEYADADGSKAKRCAAVATALSGLGLLVTCDFRPKASCFCSITAVGIDGSSVILEWDPSVDGFEYEDSGEDELDLEEGKTSRSGTVTDGSTATVLNLIGWSVADTSI